MEMSKHVEVHIIQRDTVVIYEGWNFNSGNYLFTTNRK